ncbi:MAG: multicopper oxidase domain-containing protein [Solirubrobacteraceae bacterium]|nr:multicopper oxidase domain-containing protein [Solirubrobacteraceae bacterium]
MATNESNPPQSLMRRRGARANTARPPDGHGTTLYDMAIVAGIVAIVTGIVLATLFVARGGLDANAAQAPGDRVAGQLAQAPTADEGRGVAHEPFKAVDPHLPAVPDGAVKRFEVDVYEHVTKVSDDLAPLQVWSYSVNGVEHRGTGASAPIVVEQGDDVRIDLLNGSTSAMHVAFPHSIDFHSAEVAPNKAFVTIAPGEKHVLRFNAKHPGVFMYHCATEPVLLHTGAGMVGVMIVKPRNLAPVDHELWITQQEFYFGPEPGGMPDQFKMEAKQPDVIAFNGYARQYAKAPITVGRGERVRMYVLNAGPSIWSAFHVIGTVFDKTVIEGVVGHDAQTINLAPSQGGWVEFTLDQEGSYPFVTHAFADMVKGAAGVLRTEHAGSPGE